MPSGSPAPTPFAWYDPDTSSWRTSQPSLFGASTESSPTWPRWGTWDAGAAYEAPTPAPPTAGTGSSSLLPTPNADRVANRTDTQLSGDGRSTPNKLGWAVGALLPTPAAQEPGGTLEDYHDRLRAHDGREPTFAPLSMVVQLLPTPTSRDGKGSDLPSRTGGPSLPSALLPTPRTTDAQGAGAHGEGGLDLRTAVTLLPTPRTASRTSRTAATRADSRSAPSLEQAIGIAEGQLPREFETWDELPASWHGDRTKPLSPDGPRSTDPPRSPETTEDA